MLSFCIHRINSAKDNIYMLSKSVINLFNSELNLYQVATFKTEYLNVNLPNNLIQKLLDRQLCLLYL